MALLKLSVLGTASAYPSVRYKSSFFLQFVDSKSFLLDCGVPAGILLQRGIDLLNLEGILISHLHIDHVLYLWEYLQSFKLLGRKKKLLIYGPDNLSEVLNLVLPPFFIFLNKLPYRIELKTYKEFLCGEGIIIENSHLYKDKYIKAQAEYSQLLLASYSFFFKGEDNSFFLSGDLRDAKDLASVLKNLLFYLSPNLEIGEGSTDFSLEDILEQLASFSSFKDIVYILDGSHLSEKTFFLFLEKGFSFYLTHYENKIPSLKSRYLDDFTLLYP